MLEFKVTPLNAVLSVIAGYFFITLAFPTTMNEGLGGRSIMIKDVVTDTTMLKATNELRALTSASDDPILIKVTSPGGGVLAGRDLISAMEESTTPITTFSDNYFMSMGMAIFLEGDTRLVTRNAVGMIHRGSAGSLSYGQLKAMEAELAAASRSAEEEELLIRLRGHLKMMDLLFEPEFRKLNDLLKTAPDKAFLQSIIDSLKVGKEDIYLNATDLVRAGIATAVVQSAPEEFN